MESGNFNEMRRKEKTAVEIRTRERRWNHKKHTSGTDSGIDNVYIKGFLYERRDRKVAELL